MFRKEPERLNSPEVSFRIREVSVFEENILSFVTIENDGALSFGQ